jgi:putative peptidoglycan lipid II flippase
VSRYFWIMAPTLALMAATTFHAYVCQHDEQFVRCTAIRTALPAVTLVALVAVGPLLGEWSLPLAFLLGHLAVFVLMARQAGYRYRPRLKLRAEWERRVFTNSAVLMGSGLAARIPPLIATYIASMLGPGAITALSFANKIIEPIGRSTLTGVRMLVFSRSARLYLERNTKEMSRLYGLALGASCLALMPLLAWLGFNATEVVSWVFERGRFDAEMATFVSAALLGFLPCALLYGLNTLLSNAFYAADRIAVPALVTPLGTVVYVALAWPLARELGLMGLTITYSVAAVTTFVVMLVLLRRLLPEFRPGDMGLKLAAYTVLAVAAFGGAHLALAGLALGPTAMAAASLVAGTLVYVGALAACRDTYWLQLVRYLGSAVVMRARPREGEA